MKRADMEKDIYRESWRGSKGRRVNIRKETKGIKRKLQEPAPPYSLICFSLHLLYKVHW
jgi:hypothetical protein